MKKVYILIISIILILLAVFIFSKARQDANKEKVVKMDNKEAQIAQEKAIRESELVLADDARQFTQSELEKAEAALAKGIKIEDEQNDFFAEKEENPKENYNNPEPYALPYLDYKSFQMGADQEYLYIKHQMYGVIPENQPAVNGDKIEGFVLKVEDLYSAGREKYGTSMIDGISWKCTSHACRAKIYHYAFIDETVESQVLRNAVPLTQIGMVGGGPGTDYIISAFPLSKVGLKYGQEIIFRIATESGSEKWHHATIDEVLGIAGSKFGKQVLYTVGSNKFKLKIPTKDEMQNFK